MPDIVFKPIGVVRSQFVRQEGTPIQPLYAGSAAGILEIDPAYAEALKDLEGFEHIWALVHLDRAGPCRLLVVPYRDDAEHGLFATRAPARPNPIGLSLLRVVAVEESRVRVEGLDILDGTPLLDIKPYVPEFDAVRPSRAGWFDAARSRRGVADGRFSSDG